MRGQWGQFCCAASCCCPSSRTSSTWRCPWWGGWPGWTVPCWPWCPSVTWPSVSVLSVSRQVGGDLDLRTSIYHSLSGNIQHHSHIKPSQQTLSWQGWIAPFQGQTKLYCKSFCFLLNFCHLKFQKNWSCWRWVSIQPCQLLNRKKLLFSTKSENDFEIFLKSFLSPPQLSGHHHSSRGLGCE